MSIVADTLRPDTTALHTFRMDADYDYTRELYESDFSVWDWLVKHLGAYLHHHRDDLFGLSNIPVGVWIALAIVVLLVIIGIFIHRRSALFYKDVTVSTNEPANEDNIYGVDFEASIGEALAARDWRCVVRLRYLQTLRALADDGRIDWRPSKTPTQYTREVTTEPFRVMTRHFLRVRYGGFVADETMADEMARLAQQVLGKGGEA